MLNRFQITDQTLPLGPAECYLGDPTVVGGLDPIGLTEGDVVANLRRAMNNLTYPEHTGDAPLRSQGQMQGITLTIPLLITDRAMLDTLSPRGELILGSDNFETIR